MKRMVFIISCCFVFLLCTTPVNAKLYMWIDANGQKHYSTDPPPDRTLKVQERQEIKSSGEPAPQTERPIKTSTNRPTGSSTTQTENNILKEQLTRTYYALQKINASTGSGVIWKNYVELVNDANYQLTIAIDKHSSWQKQQGIYEDDYYKLEKIYVIYDDVKTLWGKTVNNENGTIKSLISQFESKYDFRLFESDTHTKDKTTFTKRYDYEKAVNSARQKMWNKASSQLNDYN